MLKAKAGFGVESTWYLDLESCLRPSWTSGTWRWWLAVKIADRALGPHKQHSSECSFILHGPVTAQQSSLAAECSVQRQFCRFFLHTALNFYIASWDTLDTVYMVLLVCVPLIQDDLIHMCTYTYTVGLCIYFQLNFSYLLLCHTLFCKDCIFYYFYLFKCMY